MSNNTWTELDHTSWFGRSFVYDAGPYQGPSPARAPVWLPDGADGDEVDYYLFVPDGPDLATMRPVGGSRDVWRYRSGSAQLTGESGTAPPGAHLFVYWVTSPWTGAAPPVKPLKLVPPTYVTGGYGPHRVGEGWTDWKTSPVIGLAAHPPGSYVGPAPWWADTGDSGFISASTLTVPVDGITEAYEGWPSSPPPATEDASVHVETDRLTIANGWAVDVHRQVAFGGVGYTFNSQKNPTTLFNYRYQFGDQFGPGGTDIGGMGQVCVALDVGDGLVVPAVLGTMTEGVDYGPDPASGDEYQYDGSSSTFLGWDDWSIDGTYWNEQTGVGVTAPSPDLDVDLRVVTSGPGRLDYVKWSETDPTAVSTVHFPGTDPLSSVTVVFDTSSLPDPPVTVAFMPRQMNPAGPAVPYSDYPPGGPTTADRNGLFVGAALNVLDVQAHPLTGRVRPPRYRYYALGTLVFPPEPGQYLRLTQRNDGNGIVRHPRLSASVDASTSTQTSRAPRIGVPNRYS